MTKPLLFLVKLIAAIFWAYVFAQVIIAVQFHDDFNRGTYYLCLLILGVVIAKKVGP